MTESHSSLFSFLAPRTHYGVWIDSSRSVVRKCSVEGPDPGVALRPAVYPDRTRILAPIGNTQRALWPLWRELERERPGGLAPGPA